MHASACISAEHHASYSRVPLATTKTPTKSETGCGIIYILVYCITGILYNISESNLILGHISSTFGWYLGGREGYPRLPGIEKNSPEMNRSRGVRNPRYQELFLTPKNKKVVAG